jgi:hypothetical protein
MHSFGISVKSKDVNNSWELEKKKYSWKRIADYPKLKYQWSNVD